MISTLKKSLFYFFLASSLILSAPKEKAAKIPDKNIATPITGQYKHIINTCFFKCQVEVAPDFFACPRQAQLNLLKLTLFKQIDDTLEGLRNNRQFQDFKKNRFSLPYCISNPKIRDLIFKNFLNFFWNVCNDRISGYTSFFIEVLMNLKLCYDQDLPRTSSLDIMITPERKDNEHNYFRISYIDKNDKDLVNALSSMNSTPVYEISELYKTIKYSFNLNEESIISAIKEQPKRKALIANDYFIFEINQELKNPNLQQQSKTKNTQSTKLDPNYCENKISEINQEKAKQRALIEERVKQARIEKEFNDSFGGLNHILIDEHYNQKPYRPNRDPRNAPTPFTKTIKKTSHEEHPTKRPENYKFAQEFGHLYDASRKYHVPQEIAKPSVGKDREEQPFKIMVHKSIKSREKLETYTEPLRFTPQNRADRLSHSLRNAFSRHYNDNGRRILFTVNSANKIVFILRNDPRDYSYEGDQKSLGAWIKKLRVKDLTPDILNEFDELKFSAPSVEN